MNVRKSIRRLVWIEIICFALLVVFISVDDEYLLPRLMSSNSHFSRTSVAGVLDTVWVAFLFGLALYIQAKDFQKIKLLEGILSVCASCKKIRDGKDHWTPIEDYIQQRSDADFSHTICPDCGIRLYGDLFLKSAAGGSPPSGI